MTTTEERLSRLEGAYEHVATKADLANFEVRIADARADSKADLASLLRNMYGILITFLLTALAAVTSLVIAVLVRISG